MLNIRPIILSVVLVVLLLLAVPLVAARTEVVSDPSSDLVIALDHQERYDKMNKLPIPHQDRYDKMNRVPIPSYRSPLDVCYDVPLREVASCRIADPASVP
jgi:hypothetical protein